MDLLSATRSEGVGLIVRAISFRDFQPMWSQITNVTDGQTDGRTDRRTTCDPKTAHMHLSALRGKQGYHFFWTTRYVWSVGWSIVQVCILSSTRTSPTWPGLVSTVPEDPSWSFCVTVVGFEKFVVAVLHATVSADSPNDQTSINLCVTLSVCYSPQLKRYTLIASVLIIWMCSVQCTCLPADR